jgi:hypothetical protein
MNRRSFLTLGIAALSSGAIEPMRSAAALCYVPPTAIVDVVAVDKIFHKRFENLVGEGLNRTEPYTREISQYVARVRVREVVNPGPGLVANATIEIRYDLETIDPPIPNARKQDSLNQGDTTTVRLIREGETNWILHSPRHSQADLARLESRYPSTDLGHGAKVSRELFARD